MVKTDGAPTVAHYGQDADFGLPTREQWLTYLRERQTQLEQELVETWAALERLEKQTEARSMTLGELIERMQRRANIYSPNGEVTATLPDGTELRIVSATGSHHHGRLTLNLELVETSAALEPLEKQVIPNAKGRDPIVYAHDYQRATVR